MVVASALEYTLLVLSTALSTTILWSTFVGRRQTREEAP